MTETRRKLFYWLFKVLGVLISFGLPTVAICEKFPLWTEKSGTGYSIGVGLIMVLIVLLIVFRRTVFKFAKEHLKLQYAPPITIWIVLIVLSYAMIALSNVLNDMNAILWMGLVGCAIGTVFTFIAENIFRGGESRDE